MPKLRMLASLLASGALFIAAVPSALAWQGPVTDGAPDLNHDSPTGYYLWHDDGFHLRTHGPNKEHNFDARLRTDGVFEDLDVIRLEAAQGDHVDVLNGGHELVMHFHTFDATDGVNFHVNGGSRLSFNLRLDNEAIDTDSIFLGANGEHPDNNPFVLRR